MFVMYVLKKERKRSMCHGFFLVMESPILDVCNYKCLELIIWVSNIFRKESKSRVTFSCLKLVASFRSCTLRFGIKGVVVHTGSLEPDLSEPNSSEPNQIHQNRRLDWILNMDRMVIFVIHLKSNSDPNRENQT